MVGSGVAGGVPVEVGVTVSLSWTQQTQNISLDKDTLVVVDVAVFFGDVDEDDLGTWMKMIWILTKEFVSKKFEFLSPIKSLK